MNSAERRACQEVEPLSGLPLASSAIWQADRPAIDDPASCDTMLAHFAKHSSNAIVIADLVGGAIHYFSPAAHSIWSSCISQDSVNAWSASIHPDDRAQALASRRQAQDGQAQRFAYRLIDADGQTVRNVRECCFPIPQSDASSALVGAIVEVTSSTYQVYVVQGGRDFATFVEEALLPLGHQLRMFSSVAEFTAAAGMLQPGCALIDLRHGLPLRDDVMALLEARPPQLAIVLIGSKDTSSELIIAALKGGAADFLIDPTFDMTFDAALQQVRGAQPATSPPVDGDARALNRRLTSLPRREQEVLRGLLGGGTNKTIARSLQLSPRTVEVHRSHLMQRLNVRTLAELLHLARDAGIRG